jgi:trehalose 6-phosphate phosphatase
MHVPTHKILADSQRKLADFFRRTGSAHVRVLLLGYDGTLALCSDPERPALHPAIPTLLQRILHAARTRLVIVTGRRAFDAIEFLGLKRIEVWGCHGLERLRADGTYEMPEVEPRVLQAIFKAGELLAREGLTSLAEHKPAGIAIHWKALGDASAEVEVKVRRVWSALPDANGLCLRKFDGGMEIRAAARNRGDIVRTILSELRGGASVAYLGDDETDEDAFAALQGYGLGVLVRRDYRPTVADVWIQPPEGLVAFLTEWAAASGD